MDENANKDAYSQEELEKMIYDKQAQLDGKVFKQEYEARWPSKEEEALARADQEKMVERIREMEERYAGNVLRGVQGNELMPPPGTFKPKIDWNVINLPVEPAITGEFVFPITKPGFPKDLLDEIVKVQPLGTPDVIHASGIFDMKTANLPNTACPLPAGTCETCLGNCVRPGSGDTCGACNGTGMEEIELTTLEQLSADKLEEWIETQLDSRYIKGSKKPILVDVEPYASERIMDYLIPRFTGWDVREPEFGSKLWQFYCK